MNIRKEYLENQIKSLYEIKRRRSKNCRDIYIILYEGAELDAFSSKKEANIFIDKDVVWRAENLLDAAATLEDLGVRIVVPSIYG